MEKWGLLRGERSAGNWSSRDLEKGLLHHFRKVVRRHGDKVAVQRGAVSLPYLRLDRRSDRIARGLLSILDKAKEIPEEAPIAICCSHNENAVVSMLAVLKTGRSHVFLAPHDSTERRERILVKSRARIVLLQEGEFEHFATFESGPAGIRAVTIGELENDLPMGNRCELSTDPQRDFAISFTSGTTSEPKGVRRTQRALLHQVSYLANRCGLSERDRVAMIIPASFGSCANDIFAALLTGASLHTFSLAEEGTANLGTWLRSESITYCHCVPSVFRSILSNLGEECELRDLRWFKLGGEPLFASDIERFRQSIGGKTRILHSYGASETGGTICAEEIAPSTELDDGALPVGKPIPGKLVTVCSDEGNRRDPGEIGKIVVTSRYLAAGYTGLDTDAGVESFTPLRRGRTRFFSNDLGKFDDDGRLFLVRRFDGVVKLLGKRVDVNEVEQFFREQDSVSDCAAIVNHEKGRLDAFVAASENGDREELGRVLRQRLEMRDPRFELPIWIRVMERFPTKANGKVDRDELGRSGTESMDETVARREFPPRSDIEEFIFRVWSDLLDRDDFGIYDDFFSLGGDSLAAINFQTRLAEFIGFPVSAAVLFSRHRTIAELAEVICHESFKNEGSQSLGIDFSPLVEMRAGSDGAPVVFLPGGYGGEGEMMLFARMVPWLDECHPIFGLRATSLYRLENPVRSIREVAALYHRLLRNIFGSACPVLVGNCIAGPVAIELANHFRNDPELSVDPTVILIDSASRRGWFRQNTGSHPNGDQLPDSVCGYYRMLDDFSPTKYRGDLRLILTEAYRDEKTPRLGWDEIIDGEIRVEMAGGDHLGALRETGDQMGRQLAGAIADELARR